MAGVNKNIVFRYALMITVCLSHINAGVPIPAEYSADNHDIEPTNFTRSFTKHNVSELCTCKPAAERNQSLTEDCQCYKPKQLTSIRRSCDQTIINPSYSSSVWFPGRVASDNFPFDYRPYLNCLYTILLPKSNTEEYVCFTFHRFVLAPNDELQIIQDGKILYRFVDHGTMKYNTDINVWKSPMCFKIPLSRKIYLRFITRSRNIMDTGSDGALGFVADFTRESYDKSDKRNPESCPDDSWRCYMDDDHCIEKSEICSALDSKCNDASDQTYTHARCLRNPNFLLPFSWDMDYQFSPEIIKGDWLRVESHNDHTGLQTSNSGILIPRLVLSLWTLPIGSDEPSCLTFWYFMSNIKTNFSLKLKWYVNPNDIDGVVIWYRKGHQGQDWQKGQIYFKSIVKPGTLFFEATHTFIVTDPYIYLDDISWLVGRCEPREDISTTFAADLWRHNDWNITKGEVSVDDHCFHRPGHCILGNHVNYDIPINIRSPLTSYIPDQSCLVFWYHCSSMNPTPHITVRIVIPGDADFQTTTSYDYATRYFYVGGWHRIHIPIKDYIGNSGLPYGIEIELSSYSWERELAIDDISLVYAPCSEIQMCSGDEFRCDSGGCVDWRAECNRTTECPDNSDEKYCVPGGHSSNVSAESYVFVLIALVLILALSFFARWLRRPDRRAFRAGTQGGSATAIMRAQNSEAPPSYSEAVAVGTAPYSVTTVEEGLVNSAMDDDESPPPSYDITMQGGFIITQPGGLLAQESDTDTQEPILNHINTAAAGEQIALAHLPAHNISSSIAGPTEMNANNGYDNQMFTIKEDSEEHI